MLQNYGLKDLIFFNIKTVPLYSNCDDLINNDESLYKCFSDFVKILLERYQYPYLNNMVLNDKEKYIYNELAHLYPEYSKVVSISIGHYSNDDFSEFESIDLKINTLYGDEVNLLKKFSDIIDAANKRGYFISGYDINYQIIPFIGKRFLYNKMNIPNWLDVYGIKPWESKFIDLNDVFKFTSFNRNGVGLDILSYKILGEDISESKSFKKIHDSYIKNDFDGIIEESENDLIKIAKLFLALNKNVYISDRLKINKRTTNC